MGVVEGKDRAHVVQVAVVGEVVAVGYHQAEGGCRFDFMEGVLGLQTSSFLFLNGLESVVEGKRSILLLGDEAEKQGILRSVCRLSALSIQRNYL